MKLNEKSFWKATTRNECTAHTHIEPNIAFERDAPISGAPVGHRTEALPPSTSKMHSAMKTIYLSIPCRTIAIACMCLMACWQSSFAAPEQGMLQGQSGDVYRRAQGGRWIVSLHGSRGFATDDLAIWHPLLKGRDVGLICVQWWIGTDDSPQSY